MDAEARRVLANFFESASFIALWRLCTFASPWLRFLFPPFSCCACADGEAVVLTGLSCTLVISATVMLRLFFLAAFTGAGAAFSLTFFRSAAEKG